MGGHRPRDWEPLADKDPIPGDWEQVKEAAARYRRTADSIQRCARLLRDISTDEEGWKGKSGTEFRQRSTEVAENLEKAHGRYNTAANALAGYWPTLQQAQEDSLEARREAQTANEDVSTYKKKVEDSEDKESEHHDRHGDFKDQLGAAEGALSRAREKLSGAISARNRAAERAKESIGDFIDSDPVKDDWKDNLGGALAALKDFIIKLGDICSIIAAVCGVLALLVGWIPIIGQALAGILGIIALVATVISLIGNILEGDWLGAALDVLAIATFGIGRAAGAAAKAGAAGTKASTFRAVQSTGIGNRAMRMGRARDMFGATQAQLKAMANAGPRGLLGHGKAAFGGLKGEFGEHMLRLGAAKTVAMGDALGTLKAMPGGAVNAFTNAWEGGRMASVANQVFGNVDMVNDAAKINAGIRASGGSGGIGLLNGTQLFGGQIPNTTLAGAAVVDTYVTDFIPGPTPAPDVTGNAPAVGDFQYNEQETRVKPPEIPVMRPA